MESERNQQIFNLRKEGKRFVDISSIFKITPSRVRQIFLRVERYNKLREKQLENQIHGDGLKFDDIMILRVENLSCCVESARIRNCFKWMKVVFIFQMIEMTPKYLLSTENFGKKSLNDLVLCLSYLGISLGQKLSQDQLIKYNIEVGEKVMEMHKVQSSNIAEVGHDGENLRVVFKNGATYDYAGVPEQQFHNLLNADSIGGHLNTHIKGVYDHERIS